MKLDFLHNPYTTRRTPMVAANGVVATSHPLAAQAGLSMLQAGGSAVDAAVATAAALTVLEPTSNGIGSDAFALIWDGQKLHGLNGSGRAPAALTVEAVQRAGYQDMPFNGWLPVTVPGAVAAWQDLHSRFGKLPFEHVLQPAITYAAEGAPLQPIVANNWARGVEIARQRRGAEFAGFLDTFAPGGSAPAVGQRFVSAGHARTLRMIAEQGVDAFYKGQIAEAIVGFARETGGLMTADDLAAHTSTWSIPFR